MQVDYQKAAEGRQRSDVVISASPWAAYWALAVFCTLELVSIIDRGVMAILTVDIKADMGFSDLQLGLLQGVAFALFYSIASLAIGTLVDHGPRRLIGYVGVTVWSLAAMLTALSRNFHEMLFARMLIGAGEATVTPVALSLLSQYFPPARLAGAISMFIAAGSCGSGLALGLGGGLLEAVTRHRLPGLIGALAPWRQVILLIGAPGLLLAFLMLTVRDVPREMPGEPRVPTRAALNEFLRGNRGLAVALLVTFGLTSMISYASSAWAPTYGRRVVGMSAGEVGTVMGLTLGLGGILGPVIMGLLVDRLTTPKRPHPTFVVFLGAAAVSLPTALVGFVADRPGLFILGQIALQGGICATFGSLMANLQSLAPMHLRGRVGALTSLISNVVGLAMGPFLVGLLTDRVFGAPMRVGWSIATVIALAGTVAASTMWRALRIAQLRTVNRHA